MGLVKYKPCVNGNHLPTAMIIICWITKNPANVAL